MQPYATYYTPVGNAAWPATLSPTQPVPIVSVRVNTRVGPVYVAGTVSPDGFHVPLQTDAGQMLHYPTQQGWDLIRARYPLLCVAQTQPAPAPAVMWLPLAIAQQQFTPVVSTTTTTTVALPGAQQQHAVVASFPTGNCTPMAMQTAGMASAMLNWVPAPFGAHAVTRQRPVHEQLGLPPPNQPQSAYNHYFPQPYQQQQSLMLPAPQVQSSTMTSVALVPRATHSSMMLLPHQLQNETSLQMQMQMQLPAQLPVVQMSAPLYVQNGF